MNIKEGCEINTQKSKMLVGIRVNLPFCAAQRSVNDILYLCKLQVKVRFATFERKPGFYAVMSLVLNGAEQKENSKQKVVISGKCTVQVTICQK